VTCEIPLLNKLLFLGTSRKDVITMGEVTINIKEIVGKDGLRNSARVIRDSFKTVASEFALTRKNCPTHPSFVTARQLDELQRKGLKFFGLFLGDKQIGFVAVEKADKTLYYIEKLAVLPPYRHAGYGRTLMEFALNYVRKSMGEKVSLGVIDEHTVLKNWYKTIGFEETITRKYDHLPFTVCFMEKEVNLRT
jgi:ribosomal protein S18 acetylase RimI-like enzyme